MTEKRFAFIGAGALGFHLTVAFKKSGQQVVQIISRSTREGQALANEVDAIYSKCPEDIIDSVTHIILTLPDQAINEVLPRLPKRNSVVIHTSGSFPMSYLGMNSTNFGVLYPLQTFSKDFVPTWEEIPFFLEASSKEVESDLLELVGELGASGILLNSERRKKLHLAAVFASNFTNYMQGKAQKLISEIGLSDDLIRPLVVETIRKAYELGAEGAQTGPARRGDHDTIKKHLDLLSCCANDKNLYRIISNSISDEYE